MKKFLMAAAALAALTAPAHAEPPRILDGFLGTWCYVRTMPGYPVTRVYRHGSKCTGITLHRDAVIYSGGKPCRVIGIREDEPHYLVSFECPVIEQGERTTSQMNTYLERGRIGTNDDYLWVTHTADDASVAALPKQAKQRR
jgi:hypothetical protein